MDYLLHILVLISLYIIVGISLNLICGYAGLVSLCHAGFYGIGAYTAALLSLHFKINILLTIPASVLLAALVGVMLGGPSLRIRDDLFAVTTFGFQIILYQIMNNCVWLTNGPLGLTGIPQPEVFGHRFSSKLDYLALSILCVLIVYAISRRVVGSPFGSVLRAVREDEILAQSLGKRVNKYKVAVFALGGGMCAIAGAVYAYYVTYIDPTSFTISESIFMLSIVIVGGSGRIGGSVVGAAVLVSIPELLRLPSMPGSIAPNIRQLVYGVLLVAFAVWRPKGILGQSDFRRSG